MHSKKAKKVYIRRRLQLRNSGDEGDPQLSDRVQEGTSVESSPAHELIVSITLTYFSEWPTER